MTYSFNLSDTPIKVTFKNIQNLRITIYPPDGRVCISAPQDATREAIRQFAISKARWIEKQREKFRLSADIHTAGDSGRDLGDRAQKNVQNLIRNHATHFVWGAAYNLELIEQNGRPKIILEEKILKLYAPPGTTIDKKRHILDKWYSRLMREAAPVLIRKWEPLLGVRVHRIFYQKMKSRWGTCNYRRHTIRLNTELAKKTPACLEYVIVHEMLHIIEPAHNRRFYQLMTSSVPTWKTIREKMNAGEI
jgi:predicted metal-dependent hydrolase